MKDKKPYVKKQAAPAVRFYIKELGQAVKPEDGNYYRAIKNLWVSAGGEHGEDICIIQRDTVFSGIEKPISEAKSLRDLKSYPIESLEKYITERRLFIGKGKD